MSTNLKNYIIELNNNLKYLIKSEQYIVNNTGIITFTTNNQPIASFQTGTWLNCYELTEPSIIYTYNNNIQNFADQHLATINNPDEINYIKRGSETNKDELQENENQKVEHKKEETIVSSVQSIIELEKEAIVNDNLIEDLKNANQSTVDSNAIDNSINNNKETDSQNSEEYHIDNDDVLDIDNHEENNNSIRVGSTIGIEETTVLRFFKKEDNERGNVREKIINQLDELYLTEAERKRREQNSPSYDDIEDFYKDIGRPVNKEILNKKINETYEEVNDIQTHNEEETSLDKEDGSDNILAEDEIVNSENNIPPEDVQAPELDDELFKLLLEGNDKESSKEIKKEIDYFDDDPMSALLSTDFTIQKIEVQKDNNVNEDPLAALDEMVDSQDNNANEDPLAALDEMVDSQDNNANEDPLAALDEMVDSQDNNANEDPLAALDEMVDSQDNNANEDPLAALDEMVDSQDNNANEDPFAALDEMVDNKTKDKVTKEYETFDNLDKDENIDEEDFKENTSADVLYEDNQKTQSLDELLSKLPIDDKKFEASYHDSSREIRRVPSSQKDLDALDSLIDKKSNTSKKKDVPTNEFRNEPEAIEVKKPVENYQLRNSQGRLLTPQELKIKKEKIIEQTIFQYCSKFPKFNSKHLSEILSKNPKAMAYKIVEEDIIWVAAKMIRASSIEAKYFIREQEQKKLNHFLPNIIGKHWDGSISNLSSVIQDIPQLSTSNLMDISVWLLENSHL